MSEEDKTYCGRGDDRDIDATIEELQFNLGVSRQDVLDAIDLVGSERSKLEEFFRSKENWY